NRCECRCEWRVPLCPRAFPMARWHSASVRHPMSVRSASDKSIQAMLRTFEQAYRAEVPFREDGDLGQDLAAEVRPVLEALSEVASASVESKHLHEAYALLTLLARRAGLLGATPSAALGLLSAIVAGLEAGAVTVPPPLQRELCMVVVEGYS